MNEFELISWIRSRSALGANVELGIGDDAAVLRISPGRDLVATTDLLMDGRHFRLGPHRPEEIGYKALAVNLSDIAAMAAVPFAAFVSVALPRNRGVEIAQGLHAGMSPLAERFSVALAGGDTNAWDGPLVVGVTVLGETTARGFVRRSGAQPGDVVFVTGPLGGSLAGRHMRPEPRVREALALHAAADLHALIDISDGLASDLGHVLAESGGLGAILDARAIPIHPDALALSALGDVSALDHALGDGEDFELCLTASPAAAAKLEAAPPCVLHRIGTITAEPLLRLRLEDGRIEPVRTRGFDHFVDDSKTTS